MRVAVCSPSVEPGDAVSNDILGELECLSAMGVEARLFAHQSMIQGLRADPVSKIQAFVTSSDDLFLYHYAIGWDEALTMAKKVNCRIALKYHNVTPPSFFHGISAEYEQVCTSGLRQLRYWAALHPWRCIGDSQFNVDGLVAVGADPASCRVCPPYSPVEELECVDADLEFLDSVDDGSVNILSVGRLAPNKNHAAVIRAFAEYNATYRLDSRLIVVGAEDARLESYASMLRGLCRSLGVDRKVLFTGKVSESRLKAAYMAARVFVSTSLHEGFCVPAVEAMAMSIPVVALAAGAVAETVGEAGLVWAADASDIIAVSIDRVVRDASLAVELGRRGRQRYAASFSTAAVDEAFSGIMKEAL
ncbi:MAG TPA: glycosyltransferase [Candidatus Cryosericum sp.]